MNMLMHEGLYRGRDLINRIRDYPITICGAGALGGNLAEQLARSGFGALKVIDRDRVEAHNLNNQPFYSSDVGAQKARILAGALYRAIGAEIDGIAKELNERNVAQLLKGPQLVVDVFDNSASRALLKSHCERAGLPCVHAGLSDGYAEIIWNARYRVPTEQTGDVCDYPLARNLVTLTVSVLAEVITGFIAQGEQRNYTITLKDLSVRPLR